MLRYNLLHPPLLEALAEAGHGSRILIADGNFPYSGVSNGRAKVVYLNLRPGQLTVPDVLESVMEATNFEAAVVMRPPQTMVVDAHDDYRRLLDPEVTWEEAERHRFYDLVRGDDVGLVVATGDERLYANLLLTVGLR